VHQREPVDTDRLVRVCVADEAENVQALNEGDVR
jgi:hypothetical protein